MKNVFFLLVFIGLGVGEAMAQKTTSEDILLKQIANENIFIRQAVTSTDQTITLKQQVGSNVAVLSQQGTSNNVVVQQQGISNTLNLNQLGNGNSYEGYFNGNYNQSDVLQAGNGNRLVQEIISNDQSYQITQLGNNNELIQVETGVNAVPVQIKQEGNGMNLTIENGIIVQ